MLKYLRYFAMPVLLLLTTWSLMLGGWWLWASFLGSVAFYVIGDAVLPEDAAEPSYNAPWLLNLLLYSALPLLFVMNAVFLSLLGIGDPIGLVAWVDKYLGLDMNEARSLTDHAGMWVGGVLSVGLLNATAGTNIGHELTHRTQSLFDMLAGRWMLAFTCDSSFAIEHVYGHHVRVATKIDPATAKRGESVYPFILRSTIYSYTHAWVLEQARLAKFNHSIFNPIHSRMMRGNLMALLLFVAAYYLAGWAGVGLWIAVVIWGKALLEIVNYFEHYGLVRVEGQPVQPRHSWNSNKVVSGFILFNLTRHSHHHAEAEIPFWKLRAYKNAPMLPYGYLTTILIALVPPVFKNMMQEPLNHWDQHHASPEERKLALAASQTSGMRGLKILHEH